VSFPVANSWHQLPGVVVMLVDDRHDPADERWSGVLLVVNATPWLVRQSLPMDASGFELHPVQAQGCDDLVRTAEVGSDWVGVPERTAAVFVRPR